MPPATAPPATAAMTAGGAGHSWKSPIAAMAEMANDLEDTMLAAEVGVRALLLTK